MQYFGGYSEMWRMSITVVYITFELEGVKLCGGCSVLQRVFSTVRGDTNSILKNFKYCEVIPLAHDALPLQY